MQHAMSVLRLRFHNLDTETLHRTRTPTRFAGDTLNFRFDADSTAAKPNATVGYFKTLTMTVGVNVVRMASAQGLL